MIGVFSKFFFDSMEEFKLFNVGVVVIVVVVVAVDDVVKVVVRSSVIGRHEVLALPSIGLVLIISFD